MQPSGALSNIYVIERGNYFMSQKTFKSCDPCTWKALCLFEVFWKVLARVVYVTWRSSHNKIKDSYDLNSWASFCGDTDSIKETAPLM